MSGALPGSSPRGRRVNGRLSLTAKRCAVGASCVEASSRRGTPTKSAHKGGDISEIQKIRLCAVYRTEPP